nr:PREDICTED: uncharacterized protein LOC109030163 isoform X2 [Bemisia tabaci]
MIVLQGVVDKSTADKHFKAIGEYLKQKNLSADALESVKKYTTSLETKLLILKDTTKQMSMRVERLRNSLRAEQETVKNQTRQIDEYAKAIRDYRGNLNDFRGDNKLLTEKLRNQTDALRCKNSEDIHSGILLIELMFNDLFKVKERAKQWTKFYQTMQAIVHQTNTTTNDTSEQLKPLLKLPPGKILKDLEMNFNSAEKFGQTVEQFIKRLSDDIEAYHHGKPLSDNNITIIMNKALEIIIDAFFLDAQISKSKLKAIN